jgi:hypothetical protein
MAYSLIAALAGDRAQFERQITVFLTGLGALRSRGLLLIEKGAEKRFASGTRTT